MDRFDIFISYAHADTEHDLHRTLASEIQQIFQRRTGHELKIFYDQNAIKSSDLWETRIRNALQTSKILVAILSQEYLRSRWCRREWEYFEALERIPSTESGQRIFPVLLNGETQLQATAATSGWNLNDITSRQYVDLRGDAPGTEQCRPHLERLLDGIVYALNRPDLDPTLVYSFDTVQRWASTGHLQDEAHYIVLLANATKATIIGITNEGLVDLLREALELKRRQSTLDHFWSKIRIVYLDEKLLDRVTSERFLPRPHAEAVYQRRISAGYSALFVRSLLQEYSPTPDRWELYKSSNQLIFTGTLVTPPNQSPIVRINVPRPHRSSSDHLYIEFQDRPDQAFASAFDEVVDSSTRDIKAVPVGAPGPKGAFHCVAERNRDQLLVDGSQESDWLPVALIVTWWHRNDQPTLVVQMRTKRNSYRELNHLSHPASYVYFTDVLAAEPSLAGQPAGYELPPHAPYCAALRRIEMDTGGSQVEDLEPVGTSRYLCPDKENLFFYIYKLQIPSHFRYYPEAQLQTTTIEKLITIRERQVLSNTRSVFERYALANRIPPAIAEITKLNLQLHGLELLWEELAAFADTAKIVERIDRRIASLEQHAYSARLHPGRTVEVAGLPGLQYREFFSLLLPLYRDLKIPGAAERCNLIEYGALQNVVARLKQLYSNEEVMRSDTMRSIPIEI